MIFLLLSFLYETIFYPIIYIFPAYAANGAPILFGGWGPIDKKKKLFGKRIFGDNKTIRGAISGILAGLIVGLILYPFFNYMPIIGLMMGIGTIVGDLFGSFIKRRLGFKPGMQFPIMDQFGFVIFALIFAFSLGHMPNIYGIAFIIILTGIMHPATNIIANKMSLKDVPW